MKKNNDPKASSINSPPLRATDTASESDVSGMTTGEESDFSASSDASSLFSYYPELEKEKKKKKKRRVATTLKGKDLYLNIFIVLLSNVIADGARGIVIPTQLIYVLGFGGNIKENGLIFAIFVVGRFISAYIFGYIADKRPLKEILIFSSFIGAAGHMIYGIAVLPGLGDNGFWVAMVGRFLTGFGSGSIPCVRAFITAISPKKKLTRFLSWSLGAQFIGFALAPALCVPFASLNQNWGSLNINVLNFPSMVLGFINVFIILVVVFIMPSIAPKPKVLGNRVYTLGTCIYLFVFFVIRTVIAFLETSAGLEYAALYDPNQDINTAFQISLYFTYLGLGGLVVYLIVDFIVLKVPNHIMLILSLYAMVAGSLLMPQYPTRPFTPLYMFSLGAALVWSVGSPASSATILAGYSEMLFENMGDSPQGAMQGIASSIGSVGSIVVRLLTGYLPLYILFVACGALSLISAFLLAYYHSRPPKVAYVE